MKAFWKTLIRVNEMKLLKEKNALDILILTKEIEMAKQMLKNL
jgi:hypothetical protein